MASDTELQKHSSNDNIKSAIEENAHTIHSFSEQAAAEQDTFPANTAVPRSVDDEDEDEEKSMSLAELFVKFFSKTTPYARAGRYMLSAIFVCLFGTFLWYLDPNMSFIKIPTVPSIIICAALVMFGYGFTLMIIHSFVVFAHRRNSLYNSRALNWLTEFEEYIAASILFSMFIVLFANLDAYGSVPKPLSFGEDPWHFLTRVVLLGSQSAGIYVHFGIISLVMVVLAAVKRHFMHKMAIEFNYSNYCDRVEECLFVERMLQALMKSKQAFRFRKKWKTFMSESTPRKRNVQGNQTTVARSEFVEVNLENQLDLKNFSDNRTTSPSSTSPSSPQFAPINSPSSGKNVPASSATHHTSSASNNNVKREQFEEFAHLANRTAAQFDSLTVTDIRVEIHREARRLASQLFKWLVNPLRGNISAAELEPFIENTEDLNRFISLLRKQKKVNIDDSAVFSEGDLRRAIDSSLQERYGLAKSMETIEMALGKIDSILDCVLFIFGAALMSVYIFQTANTTLITLSGIFVPATVIFESAVKSIVESIIFLLVIHPFDIGDRVFLKLDTSDGKVGADAMDNLVVVEMNLMSTVFERWDGVCVYVANSVLAQKVIYNIRRSGSTLDVLKMSFGHDTSLEQLEQLRARLLSFLRNNRQDFTEFLRVNVDSLDRINLMNITILVQHVGNWQDLELQMARRTKTLSFIKSTVEELGIHYELPKQRVQLLEHSPVNIDRTVNL